jgi:pyrroloquinoline quinone (PQQ) biosynthesis protein C
MSRTELRSELEAITKKAVSKYDYHPLGQKLIEGSLSAPFYKGLLVQVTKYVAESANLLGEAGRQLAEREPELSRLLLQKAPEEAGHQNWAYNDLDAMGVSRDEADAVPRAPATDAYLAFNKFIVREYPAGFLGTALVLETLSVARAATAARNLCRFSGIPNVENAVSFLESHGALDEGHVEELLSLLEALPRGELLAQVQLCAEVVGFLHPSLIVPFPQFALAS